MWFPYVLKLGNPSAVPTCWPLRFHVCAIWPHLAVWNHPHSVNASTTHYKWVHSFFFLPERLLWFLVSFLSWASQQRPLLKCLQGALTLPILHTAKMRQNLSRQTRQIEVIYMKKGLEICFWNFQKPQSIALAWLLYFLRLTMWILTFLGPDKKESRFPKDQYLGLGLLL